MSYLFSIFSLSKISQESYLKDSFLIYIPKNFDSDILSWGPEVYF